MLLSMVVGKFATQFSRVLSLEAVTMSSALQLEALEARVLLATVIIGPGQNLLNAGDVAETAQGVLVAKVTAGRAMLEVTDLDSNGRVDEDEITCVYAGNGMNLRMYVGINGDVVTNLDPDGTLSGDGDAGNVLLNSTIAGLHVDGMINGNILAGGSVSNIYATSLGDIVVGTNASGYWIDINGDGEDDIMLLDFAPGDGQAGGSITNVN
jgi:hypothetical protein